MNFRNFLQQVGVGAGYAMQAGQAYDQGQADLELKQQQVAQAKLSAQASKDASAAIKAGMASDKATVDDPMARAKVYQGTAAKLASAGAFDAAAKLEALASSEVAVATKMQTDTANKLAQSQETLARAALDYNANPTPEGQKDLVRAALRAGVDPMKLPAPNSGEFKAWAKMQETAGMSAKDVLAAKEKAREFDDKQEERKTEFRQREADRAQSRSQTAAYQSESLALRKLLVDAKTSKTDLTAQEKGTVTAVLGAAGEATRGLEQAIKMPADARLGIFANVHDGTVITALEKAGTNVVTPELAQIYTSNMGGLALEASRVITLGAGKSANESTIKELQKAITPQAGDTNFTAMYKISTAASIIRNRLEYLPEIPESRGKQKAQLDRLLSTLSKIPEPDEILQASLRTPAAARQVQQFKGTMDQQIQQTLKKAPAAPASGTVSVDDWLAK